MLYIPLFSVSSDTLNSILAYNNNNNLSIIWLKNKRNIRYPVTSPVKRQ